MFNLPSRSRLADVRFEPFEDRTIVRRDDRRGHVRRPGPAISRPRLGRTFRGQVGVRQVQQQQRIARLRRGGLAEERQSLERTSQRDEDLPFRVEQGGIDAEFRDGPIDERERLVPSVGTVGEGTRASVIGRPACDRA